MLEDGIWTLAYFRPLHAVQWLNAWKIVVVSPPARMGRHYYDFTARFPINHELSQFLFERNNARYLPGAHGPGFKVSALKRLTACPKLAPQAEIISGKIIHSSAHAEPERSCS